MSSSDNEILAILDNELGNHSILDNHHFQDDLTIDDFCGTAAGLLATGLPAAGGLPAVGLPDAAGLPDTGLPTSGLPATGLPLAGLPAEGLPSAGEPEVLVVHQKRKPYRANGKVKNPGFAKETKVTLEQVYLRHGPDVPLQKRKALAKDMKMTETQIRQWFHRRKNR